MVPEWFIMAGFWGPITFVPINVISYNFTVFVFIEAIPEKTGVISVSACQLRFG